MAFQPSNAGAQLVETQLGISSHFQNAYVRAEALKQNAQKFEMEKEKFAADMVTSDLQQQQARNTINEQNNRLLAQEQTLAETARIHKAHYDRLKQAKKFVADTMANQTIWDDPSTVGVVEGMMVQFSDLAKDQEFAKIAEPLTSRVMATQAGLLRASTSAAAGMIDNLRNVRKPEDLQVLQNNPFLKYAMHEPTFAKTYNDTKKRFDDLADEQAKLNMKTEGSIKEIGAKASATKKAGKPAPAELISSTEKLLNSYEDLNKIKETYDKDASLRGPFIGFVRDLNPWDSDARLLAAKVQAAVPTLARGVFGEVGVLTDQDIANYKALLPNNRSPEAAAKVLFDFLADKLGRAAKSRKAVLEGNGYNTEGFNWPQDSESADDGDGLETVGGIRGRKVKGSDGKDYLVAEDGTKYRIGQ